MNCNSVSAIYLKPSRFHVLRFDNVRIPRENLLNSVADVSADGQYLSAIKDPDQVIISSNEFVLSYTDCI